jgi:hypothetical protein
MATFEDLILTNKVLRREYKRGFEEGKRLGRLEGARQFVRREIEKRSGAIPEWVEQQLNSQSVADLKALAVHLLDAQSLEALFQ